MKPHYSVSAAAIIKDHTLFAARRGNKGETALLWELPGGKIESGESAEKALEREIKEELSCSVKVLEKISQIEYEYESFSVNLSVFRCSLEDSEISLNEHIECGWFSKDELKSLSWCAADFQILESLEKLL